MRKLFGTDGVRGKANRDPMTPEVAMALGQAIVWFFRREKSSKRFIIGKDTRRSSYMLEQAIAAGVTSMGGTAIFTGPLPTPGVAFLTKAMRADAGIMISASHNPYYDNGIKFFDSEGFKLSDEKELEIENFILNQLDSVERPEKMQIGKAYRIEDAQGRYIEFVKRALPKEYSLAGLKIVVDCAHGASYNIAPKVLWELGADVIAIGVEPNGQNINDDCGALHPEKMVTHVLKEKADMGIALDGDADRLIICDEKGQVAHGDQVIALCALELMAQGFLDRKTVVGTIMTNMGVEFFLKKNGIQLVRTQVGDRYIIEQMRTGGYKLGGEPSGHVIFSKHATTGDGLIAALQILANMVKTKNKLSDMIQTVPVYPQKIKNIKVKEKKPLADFPPITNAIANLEENHKDDVRVIVRYSGTESKLRVMMEGPQEKIVNEKLKELVKICENHLL